jgi:hypothetical protein
MGVVLG